MDAGEAAAEAPKAVSRGDCMELPLWLLLWWGTIVPALCTTACVGSQALQANSCRGGRATPFSAPLNLISICVCCETVAAGGRPQAERAIPQSTIVTRTPMEAAMAVVGRCLLRSVLRRLRFQGVVLPPGLACPCMLPTSRSRCSRIGALRSAVNAVCSADGLVAGVLCHLHGCLCHGIGS